MRYRWTLLGLLTLFSVAYATDPTTKPDYTDVDLSSFKFNFDGDKGINADIPLAIRDLDNTKISISGAVIPLTADEAFSEFALVPYPLVVDQHASLQQTIICKLPRGRGMYYFADEIRIFGTIHVGVVKDGDFITNLYTMDVDRVESVPGPTTMPTRLDHATTLPSK